MGALATNDDRAPGDGFLVLWAGSAEIAERDTQVELRRAGVRVEVAGVEELVARANERAPDLIVLGGEPGEQPEPIAASLRAKSPASAVPVVALAPRASAAPRPRARFGLIARLDRELDPPALAGQLVTLLEGLSSRPPVWRSDLRTGELGPVAARLAASARCGVLVARGAGAVAVDASGAIAPATLEAPPSLKEAHFHERPPGRVRVVRVRARGEETAPSLDSVRVVVVDDDDERRDRISSRLEQARAQVRAAGAVAQAVHASRAMDPSVVVVAASALKSPALSPLWNESRLAVAPLLALDGDALASADTALLVAEIAALYRPEAELERALRNERAIADRLETLGPARWLKLLGRCSHEVTLRVFASSGRMRVDLAGGRIRGASFRPAGQEESVEGRAAVDAFMGLPFGRVLAGPPNALARLEGVSARRKPSVVGRLEPTPPSGVHRKPGLVAEEVVVRRTDATKIPFGPPKRTGAATASNEEPERSSLVPLGDLADGDDSPTSSYEAETLEQLRASLRTPDAPTAPPPTRAKKAERSVTAAPPRRGGRIAEGAGEVAQRVTPSEPIPSSEPARGQDADARDAARAGERERSSEPARAEDAAARDAARTDERERSSEPSAVDRTSARPTRSESPASAPALMAPAAARGGNGAWFAAGIALALGVGGWAAWRLHGDDPGAPRVATQAHVEPPDEETTPDPDPIRAVDDPSEGETESATAPPEPIADVEADESATEPVIVRVDDPPQGASPSADPIAEDAPTEQAAAGDPAPSVAPGADATALVEEAIAAAGRRDYPLSEAMSRRALAVSPRNPRAGYRLAVALFRQQRYDEALRQADVVSEWDPTDPLPLALRGDILSRRGRFHEAARAYQRALEVEPEFGPAERSLERLRERGVPVP